MICSLVQSLGGRYLDRVEKSICLVKAGMQAGRRWEKERARKRSGGESTNAFGMFENTSTR
jgi:hypothetical protein